MSRRDVISVFLTVYLIANARCQADENDADFGQGKDAFNNDGSPPANDDREDFEQDDSGNGRQLGPFNISLETHPFSLSLTWTVFIEDEKDNRRNDIEFKLFTNSNKINWVAFGFAKRNEFKTADWFVAWKSKKKRIYTKDCNSMTGVLHFDRHQDYDIISERRLRSFNMTVRRALDTGDWKDFVLEKGKPLTLFWAYGSEDKFSKIKQEIKDSWKSKEISLFGEKVEGNSKNVGKSDEAAEKTQAEMEKKTGKEEIGNVGKEDNKGKGSSVEKNETKNKSSKTVTKPESKLETDKKKTSDRKKIKPTTKGILHGDKHKIGRQQQTEGHFTQNMPISSVTSPCTVVIEYTRGWRDYIKLKERSVYYAILGSSAIMTGMIVLILACCCRKSKSDPRRSKVAFYKVDDYDDEQVEFLKERA